jgi:hypothetical protein
VQDGHRARKNPPLLVASFGDGAALGHPARTAENVIQVYLWLRWLVPATAVWSYRPDG